MNFQIERLKQLPLHKNETWQGGLVRMPGWVAQEGEKPYRPWMAAWISVQKDVVHTSAPCSPEEKNFAVALNSLVDFACNQELTGYCPARIEVKDSALAEHLSGQLAEVGIEVRLRSKLFYLNRVLDDLAYDLNRGKLPPNATDQKGVSLKQMRAFAEAACKFYQARPWQHLTDEDLIEVESPFVDAALRYTTVMGCGGETFGLSFFDSPKQYESLYECKPEEFFAKNNVWSVTFDAITELPFGDADLWEDHDLPVADDEAYPFAACFGPKRKWRRPGPDILAFMEGLMRALALTKEQEMDSGRWQKSVNTFKGTMEFNLLLPDLLKPLEKEPSGRAKIRGGIPDRRSLEREMSDLHHILENYEFANTEDLNQFLNNNFAGKQIPHKKTDTPLEKAQDIVYQAFEARGRRQLLLARKALEICPDCADAYVLLAERASNPQKAHDLYASGVAAGERALGKKFFKEESGHFWGLIQTRPYMRARLGLAQCLKAMGKTEQAVEHYREMLRLNPNDNQGVRHLLLPCLIGMNQYEQAKELLKEYKDDDVLAIWSYARALLTFREKGNTATARKHLQHAMSVNPHVTKYLLEEQDLPYSAPASYSLGSEEEAIICADELMDLWNETPDAIRWLETCANNR